MKKNLLFCLLFCLIGQVAFGQFTNQEEDLDKPELTFVPKQKERKPFPNEFFNTIIESEWIIESDGIITKNGIKYNVIIYDPILFTQIKDRKRKCVYL